MAARLPRVYWTLWVGTLVNRLGGFVGPFLALYLTRERGLEAATAGLVVSLYGAGSFLAAPVGGVLADRVGRRPTMLVGLCGGAAGMLALGLARGTGEVAALAFVAGFTGEMYRPAVLAAVSDLVPPADRMRAFGYLYWAINLGFSIAPVVAGLLARTSYFALFAGDAATTFAYGLIVWRFVPETKPVHAGPKPVERGIGGMGPIVADGVMMAFLGLSFLVGSAYQQAGVSLSLDMRAHGLDEAMYGMVIALNGVLIVLVQPFANRWVAEREPSRVLALSGLLVGAGFGLYAFVDTAVLYAAGVGLWTMGEILSTPVGAAIVANLAPADLRGRYQGAYTMSWGMASFVGPAAGSAVITYAGARPLWVACAVLGVVVALGHLASADARRRRMAMATASATAASMAEPAAGG